MAISVEGLNRAADLIFRQSGIDPTFMRLAAIEIEKLRKQNDRLEKEVRQWRVIVANLECQIEGARQ